MIDEKSIHPRIEASYAFTPDMINDLVKKFSGGNFTQGSAVSKIRFFNPKNLIVQHLPVKERVNKCELNRMRNGCIVEVLTSVDVRETIKLAE